MKKGFIGIAVISLVFSIVAFALSGYVAYRFYNNKNFFGATILTTAATSTIGDFRTNVNTSLTNLNNALGASIVYPLPYASTTHVTITAGAGIGVSTSNGTSTITNSGVLTVGGASSTVTLIASSSVRLATTTSRIGVSAINYPIQFIIENPTASENDAVFVFNNASTITKIRAVNKSVGDTVTFGMGWGSNRSTATSSLTNLFAAQTVTATTTPTVITPTAASSTPSANNVLIFWTTAASSTQLTLTAYYDES